MPVTLQTLTRLRIRALKDLNSVCTIRTPGAATQDDLGEATTGPETLQEDVPCRLVSAAAVTAREVLQQATQAVGQQTQWLIVLPWNQSVTSRDTITLTHSNGMPLAPPRHFAIVQVAGPHDEEIRRVVWVEESS